MHTLPWELVQMLNQLLPKELPKEIWQDTCQVCRIRKEHDVGDT